MRSIMSSNATDCIFYLLPQTQNILDVDGASVPSAAIMCHTTGPYEQKTRRVAQQKPQLLSF